MPLVILAIGILILFFLIVKVKLNSFLALLLVAELDPPTLGLQHSREGDHADPAEHQPADQQCHRQRRPPSRNRQDERQHHPCDKQQQVHHESPAAPPSGDPGRLAEVVAGSSSGQWRGDAGTRIDQVPGRWLPASPDELHRFCELVDDVLIEGEVLLTPGKDVGNEIDDPCDRYHPEDHPCQHATNLGVGRHGSG